MSRTPDQAAASFPTRCATGLPILLLGVVSLLGGLEQRNPALLALGCTLISIPAVIYLLLRRSSRDLRFARIAPSAAFEGDPVEVGLALSNQSDQSLFFPQVAEVFAPEIHAAKRLSFSGRLAPDEKAQEEYSAYCILPRGVYTLGPAWIRLTDPLGWFEVRCRAEATQSFKVYPQVHRFDADDQIGRCVSWLSQDRTVRGVGESNEFHSVREYRPGDSRRRIHWGLTARLGRPVVREFARTAVGDLTIVLDASSAAVVGWGRASSVEYSVKIALAVASSMLDRGYRVRMVHSAGEQIEQIEAASHHDFGAFLDAMVVFKPSAKNRLLSACVTDLGPPRGSMVVLVHPYLFEDEGFEAELRGWVASGVPVLAILFEGPIVSAGEHDRGTVTAVRASQHYRSLGIDTFIITCGDAIETVFEGARRSTRPAVEVDASAHEREGQR
ncbi:MAG: DUF58 domain-containing protein [Planctomycetota bacterium]